MLPTNEWESYLNACLNEAPQGKKPTCIEGVGFFWTTQSTPPEPLIYEPGMIILLQGRKEGRLGDKQFVYDADNYLVLTLPLAFECALLIQPDQSLYGFFIHIERESIATLLAQMADKGAIISAKEGLAVAPAPINANLRDAIRRMMKMMGDPIAGKVIGGSLRNEILFEALRGPRGSDLAALAQQGNDNTLFNNLIKDIRRDLTVTYSVEAMARQVGMSLSSFHRAFRAKTGQSPLQYVKRLRLHAAKNMIVFEGVRIGQAARQVGYESTAQFCREYKKYFGELASESSLSNNSAHSRVK